MTITYRGVTYYVQSEAALLRLVNVLERQAA